MLNTYPVQAVKSEFSHLSATEVLESPIVVLNNVSDPIAEVLKSLNIQTVFELAVSRVFNAAHAIVQAANQPESAIASLGTVPAEYVTNTARKRPIRELQASSIELLDGIGPQRFNNLLAAAPELQTIRDLALWEPFQAARQLLNLAFGDNGALADDPDAPAELLPTAGEYATEKVYYSSIFLDEIETDQDLKDIDSQVDLLPLYNSEGFTKPATGAILTFEQAWFPQGLSLGQLLHSIALAPAESTRIAIIDWSRQTAAEASESISQAESLTNSLVQNRAISETVEAVAAEAQNGFSNVSSQNRARTGGRGFGLSIGALTIGGSGGFSSNRSQTTTVSSSRGRRSITGETLQDINQSTQQNATSVRTRRASVVREVSQSEQERLQTRIITNYNHSHALSIHYYEVVQIYRVVTCLVKVERCIFIPMKSLDFDDVRLIDRYRSLLYEGAHSATVRDLLLSSQEDVVVFRQQLQPYRRLTLTNTDGVTLGEGSRWTQRSRSRLLELRLFGNGLSRVTALKISLRDSETAIELPAANSILSIPPSVTLLTENIKAIAIDYRSLPTPSQDPNVPVSPSTSSQPTGTTAENVFANESGSSPTKEGFVDDGTNGSGDSESVLLDFPRADYLSIRFHFSEEYPGPEQTSFTANFRLQVQGGSDQILLDTVPVPGDRTLSTLLNEEASYYSQLIWQNLDPQSVALLLSRYTFRGKRLVEYIDPQPLTVYGNYLVLRYNFDDEPLSDAAPSPVAKQAEQETLKAAVRKAAAQPASSNEGERLASPTTNVVELQQWRAWKAKHIDFNHKIQQEIPMGTGGTFAEAVLGRYNASEKLDITRFWDWQTSPIPQQAPEIAPLTAGSRGTTENLTPGQLDAPVVNIMNPPNLPDPQGLAGALNAITTANLFRDMSGLSGALQLAQQGITSASDSAVASGAQAGQNLQVAADLQKAQLDAATKILTGGVAGLSGAGGSGGSGNLSRTGALINHGARLDREARARTDRSGQTAGSGGGSSGSIGNGSGRTLLGSGGSSGPASHEANAYQNALSPLHGAVAAVGPILGNADGGSDRSFKKIAVRFIWDRDEDEADVRAFRPSVGDRSGELKLEVEVKNPPEGAYYEWVEIKAKTSSGKDIQRLTLSEETESIQNHSRSKVRVKRSVFGIGPGLTQLEFRVMVQGKEQASESIEISVPQFISVLQADDFNQFIEEWSLQEHRATLFERVRTLSETLLEIGNVRMIWELEPFNEPRNYRIPTGSYTRVYLYNKNETFDNLRVVQIETYEDYDGIPGGYGAGVFDEKLHISLGRFAEDRVGVDLPLKVVARSEKLRDFAATNQFAREVLARLIAETIAHAILRSLLTGAIDPSGRNYSGVPPHIMRDNFERSFRDRTGVEVSNVIEFPENSNSYTDHSIDAINRLLTMDQNTMDRIFPVPPGFD